MNEVIDSSELKKVLGENVRRIRREKGWNQSDLAERAGVRLQHICRIEKSHSSPSAEVLFAVADALGVSADTLRQLSPAHV